MGQGKLNIGKKRHRITIQSPVSSSADPFDPTVQSNPWTTVITMWAYISPISSKEVFQVGQLNMKVSHRIMIRYPGANTQISAGYRALYKNRVFELKTGILNPDERNEELELLAYELDPTQ